MRTRWRGNPPPPPLPVQTIPPPLAALLPLQNRGNKGIISTTCVRRTLDSFLQRRSNRISLQVHTIIASVVRTASLLLVPGFNEKTRDRALGGGGGWISILGMPFMQKQWSLSLCVVQYGLLSPIVIRILRFSS